MSSDPINYNTDIPLTTIKSSRNKVAPVYADYNLLCRIAYGISDVNKRLIKHRSAKGKHHWKFNRKGEIDLLSVTDNDRSNMKLPNDNEKVLTLIEIQRKQDAERKAERTGQSKDEEREQQVYCDMAIVTDKNFPQYYNAIKAKYNLPAKKCNLYARRWAAMAWVMDNYERFKQCLEIFYSAWSRLFPEQFKTHKENAKISFKNFLNKCKRACAGDGIETVIVNQKSVKKVTDRRSEFQMCFLITAYIQDRKVRAAEAYRKLVKICTEKGEKPMSAANVKIIFREFKQNIDLFTVRYGMNEASKKLQYASFNAAAHINSQWQADGKTIPFFVRGADGSGERWVLFIVLDNHSRKCVGYSVGRSENTELILAGLEDGVRKTGYWPYELLMDKHSFHRTEIAANLTNEAELMGATITATTNAQAKAFVERYNQNFDAIWKDFEGYLGQSPTAKSLDARPSKETMNETIKPKNYKTPDEVKAIIIHTVEVYNSTALPALDGLTPNEKYALSESKHAFVMGDETRAKMFRPVNVYKVTRGQININIGTKKYEFQLPANLFGQYNDKKVEVRYEDLTEGIYLYDLKTGIAIDTILPKRKINGAKADHTPEDIKLLNQLAGRKKGTVTQARKSQQEIIADTLKNNPEDLELIQANFLPKDIRQEIEHSKDLKRLVAIEGVNVNKIPIRGQNTVIIPISKGKSKTSPFTPENNVIKILTIEDIARM